MQIHDSRAGYGWLSIGLHWLAAISVVMLWFVGNQMTAENMPPDEAAELLRVHTSIAVTVYLLLLFRVFRRLQIGFPQRSEDQPAGLARVARVVHFALLLSILVMLFSGPMQVWMAGDSITLFDLGEIAGPFAANESAQALFRSLHATFARVLLFVFLIHVAGAMRQILFSKGETANRMLVATEGD
ncbi:MAG TPA: cytochrome b/b6 domain-containing protein [Gammaproteobacteria bacterium]